MRYPGVQGHIGRPRGRVLHRARLEHARQSLFAAGRLVEVLAPAPEGENLLPSDSERRSRLSCHSPSLAPSNPPETRRPGRLIGRTWRVTIMRGHHPDSVCGTLPLVRGYYPLGAAARGREAPISTAAPEPPGRRRHGVSG